MRKIVEFIEAVEVIDRKIGNEGGVADHAQINGETLTTLFVAGGAVIRDDASAVRAEMILDGFAAHIMNGGTFDIDDFAAEAVRPKRAIAAADRAVAGRDTLEHAFVGPLGATAVAGSFEFFHGWSAFPY